MGNERLHSTKLDDYDVLRENLEHIIGALDHEPETWSARLAMRLVRFERSLGGDSAPPSDVVNFYRQISPVLIRHLATGEPEGTPVNNTHDFMVRFSRDINSGLGSQEKPVRERFVEYEELESLHFDRFRIIQDNREKKAQVLSENNGWIEFPIPSTHDVWHKGGFPRVLLKLYAGADEELIEAELPPNDLDIIFFGEDAEEARRQSENLGVDATGIEMCADNNFTSLCRGRDIDLNGCFAGKDGLYFSRAAFRAAKSGHIELEGAVTDDRALFGPDWMYYQGVKLIKPRGLQRLLKFCAEGKARSFDFVYLNKQVDLGIYWLVLTRKFSGKKDFEALMMNLFQLAQDCGQVRDDEKTVFDVLERVHFEYPHFNFASEPLDDINAVRWLSGKLRNQLLREYRWRARVPSGLDLERMHGDDRRYKVSLDPSRVDPGVLGHNFQNMWDEFLRDCDIRTQSYYNGELDEE